jgi:membrane-bound lytic murein transglycosylase B
MIFIKLKQTLLILLVIAGLQSFTTFNATAETRASYLHYPAMQKFINRMVNKGFDRNTLVRIFSNVQRDENILAKVNSPAEAKPWHKYRPIFVTEKRANAGVQFWNRHQKVIQAASQQYGVPPEIIVAIIGVETLYGRNTGKHNVLQSLTTLAMDFPKREKFYTDELDHFFHFIREEKIPNPFSLKGSYAGAMGLGQFISSSYRNYGIDFNGDKHRDLWHPEDAIGSVANYFSRHGWKAGGDITVPARITSPFYGKIVNTRANKPVHSLQQLAQFGVQPQGKISSTRVALLELEGARGKEYWVTGDNFYVITRYNHSPKYAMAVYQLANEIKRRKKTAR